MVLVCAAACAGQQTKTTSQHAPSSDAASASSNGFFKQLHDAGMVVNPEIRGRVVLDGHAVTYFGVTLTKDATFFLGFDRAVPIKAQDGRFRIPLPGGVVKDLVIAGPGFKRRIIRSAEIKGPDLGDIIVVRDQRIEGTVRDLQGAPVANARVTFSPSPGLAAHGEDDELHQLRDGIISVVTDAQGHYVIEGAAPAVAWSRSPSRIPGPMQIRAQTSDRRAWMSDHRSSLPIRVRDADAVIDMTIKPTGTIEVSGTRSAVARPAGAEPDMIIYPRGGTRFDDLPVGDYDVMDQSHYLSEDGKQRISVKANAVTSVTLTP